MKGFAAGSFHENLSFCERCVERTIVFGHITKKRLESSSYSGSFQFFGACVHLRFTFIVGFFFFYLNLI